MYEERERLLRFLQSNNTINVIKAREIAAYFEEQNVPKGAHFLTEGRVSREYLVL